VTLHYQDGRTAEGIILRFSQDVIRLAVRGDEETVVLRNVDGAWISENLELVRLSLGRPQSAVPTSFSEGEFICSPFLASHLIDLLRAPRRVNWMSPSHTAP
jgi:hypothetical protein